MSGRGGRGRQGARRGGAAPAPTRLPQPEEAPTPARPAIPPRAGRAAASRSAAAFLVLLALAGCGDLETAYGVRGRASVNGVDVLHDRVQAALSTASFARLSPRAAERDLLVHVMREAELPDAAACAWIGDWLEEADGRQFVLVLRDGALAPWLCRRWSAEARAEAAQHPERAAGLEAEAVRLDGLAALEESLERPIVAPGATARCDLFAVEGMAPATPQRLSGAWEGAAPLPMRLSIRPTAADAETLVAADGRPWAIAVPVADSRLVVVAGATALLDAAQVDRNARALTAALIAGLVDYGDPQRAGWIEHLAVRGDEEPPPPNILALLFGTPPFSWVAFHLLALVLVFVAWKATWLGRTEARRDRRVERFARHVDALALHLRRAGALRAAVEAIARALGRAPPPPPTTAGEAFAAVERLYRPERGAAPVPPESA